MGYGKPERRGRLTVHDHLEFRPAAAWLLNNGGEHHAAAEKLRFNRALVQRHRIGNIRCS
jgi:hypothetical protein